MKLDRFNLESPIDLHIFYKGFNGHYKEYICLATVKNTTYSVVDKSQKLAYQQMIRKIKNSIH